VGRIKKMGLDISTQPKFNREASRLGDVNEVPQNLEIQALRPEIGHPPEAVSNLK
jgi:hypothetical protein